MAKTDLTAQRLRELLHYDPKTGLFAWRVSRGRSKAGSGAGYVFCPPSRSKKYVLVGIDGDTYYAHRLAWLYMTGAWPTMETDHKDGNGLNNSFDNLRDISTAGNQHNRKSAQRNNALGLIGVSRRLLKSGEERFVAMIKSNMRRIYLGTFKTAREATDAYLVAKQSHHLVDDIGRQNPRLG